jgi:hypothetical protein
MAYHGISTYQFYTALRHVNEGSILYTVHDNQVCDCHNTLGVCDTCSLLKKDIRSLLA